VQYLLEILSHQQANSASFPLQHNIGWQAGAVHDGVDITGCYSGLGQKLLEAF
jgi:hypothetical protein